MFQKIYIMGCHIYALEEKLYNFWKQKKKKKNYTRSGVFLRAKMIEDEVAYSYRKPD